MLGVIAFDELVGVTSCLTLPERSVSPTFVYKVPTYSLGSLGGLRHSQLGESGLGSDGHVWQEARAPEGGSGRNEDGR